MYEVVCLYGISASMRLRVRGVCMYSGYGAFVCVMCACMGCVCSNGAIVCL